MSTRQVVHSLYEPREHAKPFHARKERFSVMVMHRRAGKTVACINDLIDKALHNNLPLPKYAYIAPLYRQAKEIAWSYLKMYAEPVTEKVMESELSVQLKNGAVVKLYGADNPDSLRGNFFDGVICDEYAQMSPRLFGEIIAPTLADRKGWIVFIGTPAGRNHFHDLWQSAQNDGRWFKKMLRASESGIIDADELAMLASLPGSDSATFAQEFECDFSAAVRGSYYGQLLNQLNQEGDYPYDPTLSVLTAWDIGYSDDTSVWFAQTNGREIKIIDFFTVSGYSVDDVLGVLRSKSYAYGEAWLPHDAFNKSFQTGKSTVELMTGAGMKCRRVPSLSVQDGIQAVRATLPKVFFSTSNSDVRIGLDALKIYQREWDDKRRMFREAPKHDWSSNPSDAFRMLALALNPAGAKRAAQIIRHEKPVANSNVFTLNNLFADRETRIRSNRI